MREAHSPPRVTTFSNERDQKCSEDDYNPRSKKAASSTSYGSHEYDASHRRPDPKLHLPQSSHETDLYNSSYKDEETRYSSSATAKNTSSHLPSADLPTYQDNVRRSSQRKASASKYLIR